MKMQWFIIAVLAVAFALVRLAPATAENEHEEHEEYKEGVEKIPATVSGIWDEVKEHEEQLGKIIADKKLDKAHEVAFNIRDMVNALPEKSIDLPADSLARVRSNAKYVADIAKRLDESGDAGDQVATEANFAKLQGFLKTIAAQYPPAVLGAGEHQGMDMAKDKSLIDSSKMQYSESGEQEIYYCPMHQEVRQTQPGKCPECGMTLKLMEHH